MCGICGYVNTDKRPVDGPFIIQRMMGVLRHRGPDDEGYFIKDNIALGHRRLSIIDLETGHQPLQNKQKTCSIVYNGEVYNFKELKEELLCKGYDFSTSSDTEVVLRSYEEWGVDCLKRLDGMFAFAIWDGRRKQLFLARDRFGEKPLYCARFSNSFLFASELKSLFQHPSISMDMDMSSLTKYFAYDYIPSPHTIIKGIFKLNPGHYILLTSDGITERPYWDFSFDIEYQKAQNLKETKSELVRLLTESVKKRLVSDVPLGALLSGGLDSSIIVAIMSTLMDPSDLKTFSIGFRDTTYDESASARLIANHFKTDHHERIIDAGMMIDALPSIFNIIDEPFADSSIVPTHILSRFAREHVTVCLGGDGADELFMGYPSFTAHKIAAMYDKLPLFAKGFIRSLAPLVPGRIQYMSLNFRLARFLRGADFPPHQRHQVWIGSFPPHEQRLLFRVPIDPESDVVFNESNQHYARHSQLSEMDRIEYMYIKTYLPDDILTKVDRASMATSLEVRSPYLGEDVAVFAGSIANGLKLKASCSKYLLKEAFKHMLPEQTLSKAKHGFAAPLGEWFRSGLKALLFKTFEKKQVDKDGIFNYDYLERLFKEHISGRMDHGRRLWSVLVFQFWFNKWIKKQEIPFSGR